MAALFEWLGEHLWSFSWEIAVLILLVGFAERLLKHYSSAFRYLLWMVVLVRLAVPVTITLPIPRPAWLERTHVSVPMIPLTGRAPVHYEQIEYLEEPVIVSSTDVALRPSEPMLPPLSHSARAGLIWSVCAGAILCVVALRWLYICHVLRNTIPLRHNTIHIILEKLHALIGLRRRVPLHAWGTRTTGTVALAGVVQPRIIIPRIMADTWPTDDVSPILLHELAHVKRADLAVNWLQVILQALFFFHPLVWFANHRIRRLREEACDDLAVAALNGSRKRYVESMLRIMEEATRTPKFGFAAMGFAKRRSNIGERIRRIMDSNTRFSSRLTLKSIVALVALAMTTTLLSCGVTSVWRGSETEPAHAAVSEDQDLHVYIAAIRTTDYSKNKDLLGAVQNIASRINRYTDLTASVKEVSLDDPALLTCHVAIMLDAPQEGDATAREMENLREYMENGGFLFGEWSGIEEEYGKNEASVRMLLQNTLGNDARFLPVPNNHMLYHSFFDFDDGPPTGTITADDTVMTQALYLEGITQDNSLSVVVSEKGYVSRWADGSAEAQLRFGVNLVVFALHREGGKLSSEAPILETDIDNEDQSERAPVSSTGTSGMAEAVRNAANIKSTAYSKFEFSILPDKDNPSATWEPIPVLIKIVDDVTFRVNDEIVTEEGLEEALRALRIDQPGTEINLQPFEKNRILHEIVWNTILKMRVAAERAEKIEIDVIDDTTYKMDGAWIPREHLEQALKQTINFDTFSWAVPSYELTLRYSSLIDKEIVDYAVHVARDLGITNITMSEEMKKPEDVWISVLNETRYRIDGDFVSRSNLHDVLHELNESGRNLYVLSLTEEGYRSAFLYLESVLGEIGADYRIMSLNSLMRPASQSAATDVEYAAVEPMQNSMPADSSIPLVEDEGKPEGWNIDFWVVSDSTYLVNGMEVHRDDLEEAVRSKSLDTINMRFSVHNTFGAYAFLQNTLRRVSKEQAGDHQFAVLNDLVVDVIDDSTVRLAEHEMPLAELEEAIADIIDSDERYRLVISADAGMTMGVIQDVRQAALHNDINGSTKYEVQ